MKRPLFPNTRMIAPTEGERLTARPEVVFFLFFFVYVITDALRSLLFKGLIAMVSFLWPNHLNFETAMLLQLFTTVVPIAGVLFYCLWVERRSLLSLGFTGRGAVREYAVGVIGGVALFGGAVLFCVLAGAVTVQVPAQAPSWGTLVLFLGGFLIQGMSEELLCRSYLMV